MKQLLIILIISYILSACADKVGPMKYKLGDRVYINPDSSRVTITYIYDRYQKIYQMSYFDSLGVYRSDLIYEFQIYGK